MINSDAEKYHEAIKYYSKAIEIFPEFYDAYNARAGAFEVVGEKVKVEQELLKTIELKPDFSIAYINLAQIYDVRGNVDEAIKYYKLFLEKSQPTMVVLLEEANQRLIELRKKIGEL